MSTLIAKKGFYTRSTLLIAVVCLTMIARAQYTTDKVMGPKNQDLADSLKKSEYTYLFTIWGKKVVAKGFNIPKSAGITIQYLYHQSDIIIENMRVGLNHGKTYQLDQ